jgi:hypothetical protein
MLAACPLNCAITLTDAACRSPFCRMFPAHALIWLAVSPSRSCSDSVRRRAVSAWSRARPSALVVLVATESVSCEALAASSALLAIWSIARRSSSAAEAASPIPLASSSVAAAMRSSIFAA